MREGPLEGVLDDDPLMREEGLPQARLLLLLHHYTIVQEYGNFSSVILLVFNR